MPFFKKLNDEKSSFFPITHKEMTRFVITLEDAVKMVLFALKDSHGGEIYVKNYHQLKS